MSVDLVPGLLKRVEERYVAGDLAASLAAGQEAERLALADGREDLADRAFCNCCPALIELESIGEHQGRLMQVVLRSQEPSTRWMATYYLAVSFDIDGERDRAHHWARRALELVDATGRQASVAATANLVGNLALLSSDLDEAESAYRRALATAGGGEGNDLLLQAQVRDNLGYVLMCTERPSEGVDLCERSRDVMIGLDASHYLHQPLQDLCYGYLLLERLQEAADAGEQGLELALDNNDRLVSKNLLYLLGEVTLRLGDPFKARRYLTELTRCYPDVPEGDEFVELLMATDLTQVVNLRG